MAPTNTAAHSRAVSRRLGVFKRQTRRLPHHVRRDARRLYRRYFRHDPFHPVLDGSFVHDVKLSRIVYRIRIDYAHRALALVERRDDELWFIWYWIGDHESYDRRLP